MRSPCVLYSSQQSTWRSHLILCMRSKRLGLLTSGNASLLPWGNLSAVLVGVKSEHPRIMAALMSAFPCSLALERVSAVTSTSHAVLIRRGVSRRRISKPLMRVQAQQQGGDGREEVERDEILDLENALGIENKTVRNVTADKRDPQRRKMSMLDAIEEQMRVNDENKPPENKFFQTIRVIGDWLIDKTENSGGQDNVVIFAFAVFPFWALALLVTSGVITLPFDLPFLRDLPQHLAETQYINNHLKQ